MIIDKVIRLGTVPTHRIAQTTCDVFAKIDFANGKLSISGVEGPRKNGDAYGSCGQIVIHLQAAAITPAPGWTVELISRFFDAWRRWHLNDMRAGCEHQRAEKWDKRPIDPAKPLRTYGKHYPGQHSASWNMLTWITRAKHPEGLLSQPCPTCGYKYGSAWLHEEVPTAVLEFLSSLPDSDKTPAWI